MSLGNNVLTSKAIAENTQTIEKKASKRKRRKN